MSLLYRYRLICQPLSSLIPKELGISFRVYPIEENGEEIENLVEDDLAVEFHSLFTLVVLCCFLYYTVIGCFVNPSATLIPKVN